MIFVDSGTTTLEMLPYLTEKQVTVVTNNVDFITQAMPYENLTIFSNLPGCLRENEFFRWLSKCRAFESLQCQ